MINKPHVLVTNDDGIESAFLHSLVKALAPQCKVSVAAPLNEQSWIGRAISRRKKVKVQQDSTHFMPEVCAWSIDGTPTDCVNIALGNLLQTPPDIVVSGINIGYNTTETLILSSGTIAGAIEGALWGLPAIAFSQCVPGHLFEAVTHSNGQADSEFTANLLAAAKHAAEITLSTLKSPLPAGKLLNVNFPATTTESSSIKDTYPAKLKLGSLFAETAPGEYSFQFSEGVVVDSCESSDRIALDSGYISRSLLDFSKVGTRPA